MNPEFNRCAVAIAPSVLIPWGGHSATGPQICISYNAYQRAVSYRLEDRLWKSSAITLGKTFLRESDICGGYTIQDDWSLENDAAPYLSLKATLNQPPEVNEILGRQTSLFDRASMSAALMGGVVVVDKYVLPLPPEITQTLAEHFLMVVKCDLAIEDFNCRFGESQSKVLDAMIAHLIALLTKGDLETAGKVGDLYWHEWTKGMDCCDRPSHPDYVAARTAGALAGFPLLGIDDGFVLFVPPKNRERVLRALPSYEPLPFTVPSSGARLCGVW